MKHTIHMISESETNYTAFYINGAKVIDRDDRLDALDIKTLVEGVAKDWMPGDELEVIEEDATSFDWESIWVDGYGFKDDWADIAAARNDAQEVNS